MRLRFDVGKAIPEYPGIMPEYPLEFSSRHFAAQRILTAFLFRTPTQADPLLLPEDTGDTRLMFDAVQLRFVIRHKKNFRDLIRRNVERLRSVESRMPGAVLNAAPSS